MGQRAQGGKVAARDVGVVHQLEQLRLDQEQVGDPLRLDRRQRVRGLVAILEHHHAPAEQGDVDQHLGQIGQTAIDELPPVGGAGDAHHGRIGGEGPPAALGNAGAAAGRHDHRRRPPAPAHRQPARSTGWPRAHRAAARTGEVGIHRGHSRTSSPAGRSCAVSGKTTSRWAPPAGSVPPAPGRWAGRTDSSRGGAEQVRRIADRHRVRRVGGQQRHHAGALHFHGGKRTGEAMIAGLELGRGQLPPAPGENGPGGDRRRAAASADRCRCRPAPGSLRRRRQRHGGLGGQQAEGEGLLEVQLDGRGGVARVADRDVLADGAARNRRRGW